ncbi:hypothetical protein IAT38_006399 [Cryptococcus sp. DSM 104549]
MEGLELDIEPPFLGHLADSSDESAGAPTRQAKDKKRLRAEKRARKEEKRVKKEKKDEKRRKEAVDAMMELSGEGAGERDGKGKGKGKAPATEETAGAEESSSRSKEKKAKKAKEEKETGEEKPAKKDKKRKRTDDEEQHDGEDQPPVDSRSPTPPHPPRRKAPATPITYSRKDRTRASPSVRESSPAAADVRLRESTRKAKAAAPKAKTPTKAKPKSRARAPDPSAPSSPESSAFNPSDNASASASNGASSNGGANPFSKAKRQRLSTGGGRGEPREDSASLRLRFTTPGAMEEWLASQFVNRKVLVDLEKEGVLTFKKGKMSAPETAAIRKAVNNYARVNRMNQDEVTELILLQTQTAASKDASRDLWLSIAAATPGRPICLLQAVVRRMYDPRGHKGHWSAEEDRQLLRAYDLTPGQWKTIASVVDRTESDCRDRYQKELAFKDGQRSGRWSTDEENRLEEIVHRVMKDLQDKKGGRADGESEADEEAKGGDGEEVRVDEKEVPWVVVAREMGTRSTTQCRIKWRDRFGASKSAKVATGVWNGGDSKDRALRVIKRLQALEYRSEKHIDWAVVRDDTLQHVSPKDVRNAYSNLKKRILLHLDQETIAFRELLRQMREYIEERIARKRQQQMSKEMIDDSDEE